MARNFWRTRKISLHRREGVKEWSTSIDVKRIGGEHSPSQRRKGERDGRGAKWGQISEFPAVHDEHFSEVFFRSQRWYRDDLMTANWFDPLHSEIQEDCILSKKKKKVSEDSFEELRKNSFIYVFLNEEWNETSFLWFHAKDAKILSDFEVSYCTGHLVQSSGWMLV